MLTAAELEEGRRLSMSAPKVAVGVGFTIRTPITRRWTSEQWEENDKRERRCVYSAFLVSDEGRSRELVAEFRRPEDAAEYAWLLNHLPALLAPRETGTESIVEGVMDVIREAAKWHHNADEWSGAESEDSRTSSVESVNDWLRKTLGALIAAHDAARLSEARRVMEAAKALWSWGASIKDETDGGNTPEWIAGFRERLDALEAAIVAAR